MVNNGMYCASTLWTERDHTGTMQPDFSTECQLISTALQLGARRIEGWSREEELLSRTAAACKPSRSRDLRELIKAGGDPLGSAFCALRSPESRRNQGATYTPVAVVEAMASWAAATGFNPTRVIEPGVGSARFLLTAAKAFPRATLLGIENDPVAAIVARANLAAAGLSDRATVLLGDYRNVAIPKIQGCTLFIGNPPYVRHHRLDRNAKEWLSTTANRLGLCASQLAGLHVHFFLATALKAQNGDFGTFITSAEWLDVNYGKLVRQLFLNGLGGQGITVVEPTARTFEDADTTSAITQFVVGSVPATIRMNRSTSATRLEALTAGPWVERARFEAETRWSQLSRKRKVQQEGFIELGELCRVHRGQVTGANRVWIAGPHSRMVPESTLFATVTRAKELLTTGDALVDPSRLRAVIDIPADLSVLDDEERKKVECFLTLAISLGADRSYVARNRKAWWSVGLHSPAPILATYMARRPPKFVRNLADARHINIAHGLYPRSPLSSRILDQLARFLSSEVSSTDGRTYAGGLTKFEPREMERIPVPRPELIEAMQTA